MLRGRTGTISLRKGWIFAAQGRCSKMSEAPRVLIVEDQFLVPVDCELQLRSVGIECVGLATTASEVLDIAEREHPDFVLMDIRLASVADGVEAAIVIYES